MKWRKLLVSPMSSTCWSLDSDRAAVVSKDRKGNLSVAHVPLAAGLLEIGPVGLQAVDRERMAEVLRQLRGQLNGERRSAVVVPTSWVRSHLLDFDDLPRKQHELLDVVRWRLKKLLPVLPAELRLAVVPFPAAKRRRALLCMAGLERAFADLEGALGDVDVQPGLITPRLYALASGVLPSAPDTLVVQHEPGFLSLLLMVGGRPALLRTKPLPADGEPWPTIARELHMALAFMRDQLEVQEELAVSVNAGSSEVEQALLSWWAGQERVAVEPAVVPSPLEPGVAEHLGGAHLASVYAVLSGRSSA